MNKNRISINAIKRMVDETQGDPVSITWKDIDITVRHVLGFEEMVAFVNETVNSCFSPDGSYNPEAADFAMMLNMIEKYTNITLPDNIDARYMLVYGTDIIDTIRHYIDMHQYGDMQKAIDKKIEHRAKANIEAIMKQLRDVVAAVDGVQTQMTDQIATVLGGVDPGDIAKLAGSMAGDNLDEGKIVRAYLEHSYGHREDGEE